MAERCLLRHDTNGVNGIKEIPPGVTVVGLNVDIAPYKALRTGDYISSNGMTTTTSNCFRMRNFTIFVEIRANCRACSARPRVASKTPTHGVTEIPVKSTRCLQT
jgi:hypothetical protein